MLDSGHNPRKSTGDNILCVRNILGSRGGSCSTWSRERHGGGFHSPLEPPVVRQTPTEVELPLLPAEPVKAKSEAGFCFGNFDSSISSFQ